MKPSISQLKTKMENVTRCRLCNQARPLLRKSHIIPEFMYASLYDKHHKLYKLAPADYVKGEGRVERHSSGEYEADILCKECDGVIISRYETYAHEVLFGTNQERSEMMTCHSLVRPGGIKYTLRENVEYARFRLFLLSVLWRASISRRPLFKEVSLGPYEERVRQMVLIGDPGNPEEFPVVLFTWLHEHSVPTDIIGQPGINRKETGIRYIFPIGGIVYVYHISPDSLLKQWREFILTEENRLFLIHTPEGHSGALLKTYFS